MTGNIIFTYGGNPSISDRDKVRFLIDDTDPASPKLGDGEIAWALSETSNAYFAAALCATTLVARYAKQVQSKTVGDLSITYGDMRAHYLSLAQQLEERGRIRGGRIHATGLTRAEVDSERANTDRVPRSFEVGMHDSPGTDRRSSTSGEDE